MNSIIFRPRVIAGALILASLFFLFSTTLVSAQSGLIPCNGVDCDVCHFVELGNNVLNWLIGVLMVVFAIIAAYAGFKLVTSAGNVQAKSDAKSKLVNAIIGLIVVLAGWILIDTVMKGLLDGDSGEITGYGPWSKIECGVSYAGWVGDPASDTSIPIPSSMPTGCSGGDCVTLSAPCKNSASCSISPSIVDQINAFHNEVAASGVTGTRVTEAMPPTVTHQSQCHSKGTCIDYGRAGGLTGAEITKVADAARNNGLTPVYEVKTQAEKDTLVSQGAKPGDIKVIPQITAPHFSIYGY